MSVIDLCNCDSGLREAWKDYVLRHPDGTVFHTPEMVQVYADTRGLTPYAWACRRTDGQLIALLIAAQVQTLSTKTRLSTRSILHATPLCDASDEGLEALDLLMQAHDQSLGNQAVFTEIRPMFDSAHETSTLIGRGYDHYGYLNFVLDASQSKDQLWSNLSKSCRKNIRRNERRGVEVRQDNSQQGVDLLYEFLELSYRRSCVPLVDRSMFECGLEQLGTDVVRISIAYFQDKPVAGGILLGFKDRVFAWYGGSERVRGIAAFDQLTWDEILWAHESGYKWYDFGGAGHPDEEYGPRDFKAKFGGQLVQFGRYRKVYSRSRFLLAKLGYSLGRRLLLPN